MILSPLLECHESVAVQVHAVEVVLLKVILRGVSPLVIFEPRDLSEEVDEGLEKDFALLEVELVVFVRVGFGELGFSKLLHLAVTHGFLHVPYHRSLLLFGHLPPVSGVSHPESLLGFGTGCLKEVKSIERRLR